MFGTALHACGSARRDDRVSGMVSGLVSKACLLGACALLVAAGTMGIAQSRDGASAASAEAASGQEDADHDGTRAPVASTYIESVEVTSDREEVPVADMPSSVSVLTQDDIELNRSATSFPDLLVSVPGVLVQKSARGFGSPYVRGFTGFRTLTLIDGVRFNNSTWREGPNQYNGLIDVYGLDRVEVQRGPGSVSFGSDAIGGVLHAVPDAAVAGADDLGQVKLIARGASAEDSGALHGSIKFGEERWAAFARATFRTLGDLEGGADVGTYEGSDYDERGYAAGADFLLGAKSDLRFYLSTFEQDGVPRIHKTLRSIPWEGTDIGNEVDRRFDMAYQLAYARLTFRPESSFINEARFTASYQNTEEEQFRIKSSLASDRSGFEVATMGLDVQMTSTPTRIGVLTFGLEGYYDDVTSFTDKFDASGNFTGSSIQGPIGDDATYWTAGAYVKTRAQISRRASIVAGVRTTRYETEIGEVEDPDTGDAFSLEGSWTATVGDVRLISDLSDKVSVYGGVSQGFRAPNLSDLSTFELTEPGFQEIPAPDLEPEYFTSLEVGLKSTTNRFSGQVSAFYTDVRDMIDRFSNGEVTADGDLVIEKANVGDGEIWGVEIEGSARIASSWTLGGFGFYTRGDLETNVGSFDADGDPLLTRETVPMSRIAPLTAGVRLRYGPPRARYWVELGLQGADKQDRLHPKDELDTTRIPPGGTPSYTVVHLRGGVRLTPGLDILIEGQNLTDEDYRYHGSGINEAGRGIVVGLRYETR